MPRLSSSPQERPPTLQARKQDFVRNEIWRAATELFHTKGFDQTTIEEIAQASNVSRRTFFRYFGSKEDLLVQAIANYQEILTEAIREFSHLQNPLDMVKHVVSRVAERVTAAPDAKQWLQIGRDNASARGAQLARLSEIEGLLAAEFAPSCKRYSRSEFTPKLLASLTHATLSLTFQAWMERDFPEVGPVVDQIFSAFAKVAQYSA